MKISVVVPVYNASSTLKDALESLYSSLDIVDEVLIINDGSSDNSEKIIDEFLSSEILSDSNLSKFRIINHENSRGLSNSYNEGIDKSFGNIVVTMHSDVVLKKNALKDLVKPFKDPETVSSYHCVIHPQGIWKKYNFWQKCLFSRLLNKTFCGLDGKFDAYRKEALLKVGCFDSDRFFRAGEDGDLVKKLSKIGNVVKTDATIVHMHKKSDDFSLKDYIYKHKQYSDAQGALIRIHGFPKIREFLRSFFRELLLLSLILPFFRLLGILLILFYAFIYTKEVYLKEFPDLRLLLLPFVNIALLFISFFYSLKGFIIGKQTV